jgi:hypothetical protein
VVGVTAAQAAQLVTLLQQGKITQGEEQGLTTGISNGTIPANVLANIISELIAGTLNQAGLNQILSSVVGGNLGYAVPGTTGVQVPSVSPGASAQGVSVGSVNVNLAGANLSGQSSQQLQSAVTQAVTTGMVQALRTAGARF